MAMEKNVGFCTMMIQCYIPGVSLHIQYTRLMYNKRASQYTWFKFKMRNRNVCMKAMVLILEGNSEQVAHVLM